jgi:cell division septation protein DedD
MEKSNASQLELFTESKNFGQKKTAASGPKSSFFTSIWNYEKVVISVIVVIAASVIAFCLGVEHGKRITLAKTNPRFDISAKARTPDAALIASQPVPKQPAAAAPVALPDVVKQQAAAPVVVTLAPETRQNSAVSLSTGSYTIQLASYKTKENAQKAARSIKKKGLSPVILSKGSYTILCVGNFTNKNAAQSRVTEFKKNYQSCYVRRL